MRDVHLGISATGLAAKCGRREVPGFGVDRQVPSILKVKIPTLAAKSAARMGHPQRCDVHLGISATGLAAKCGRREVPGFGVDRQVPSILKVKIPTLAAKSAARMGHPAGSIGSPFICSFEFEGCDL